MCVRVGDQVPEQAPKMFQPLVLALLSTPVPGCCAFGFKRTFTSGLDVARSSKELRSLQPGCHENPSYEEPRRDSH
jgi:hypothetical protein